jgi:hypothetical protein
MNSVYYVYLYLRDNGTPFYCGKGKGKRAYRKGSPNNIKIVATQLFEYEAFILEKQLIKLYGRKDLGTGILNNRTAGGEGSSGAVRSKETRINISNAKKGMEFSEEHRKNLSLSLKGKKHSEAHCAALKKPRSAEARANISKGCMGRKISEETKIKIAETLRKRHSVLAQIS